MNNAKTTKKKKKKNKNGWRYEYNGYESRRWYDKIKVLLLPLLLLLLLLFFLNKDGIIENDKGRGL